MTEKRPLAPMEKGLLRLGLICGWIGGALTIGFFWWWFT